jgi:hypothetical protein
MYRYTVQRSSPTSTLKLEASYVFRLFPMHQNANRARSSGAAAKRSASSSCSRKTGYYFNFYLFQSLCIARNCSRATSDSRYSKGRRGRSRRHPLRDKFLVQPVTAVVSPPKTCPRTSRPVIVRLGMMTVRKCQALAVAGRWLNPRLKLIAIIAASGFNRPASYTGRTDRPGSARNLSRRQYRRDDESDK